MLGIIIQARMGSTRLPGKVLRPIGGVPLLEYIVLRLQRLQHKAPWVVATSTSAGDDVLAEFCRSRGITCFRGSEADVLERYHACARAHGFDPIVRLTGDNPFTDIVELDRLIDLHLSTASDFSHSFAALPVGVGTEIFSFKALDASLRLGKEPHHLEHVDEYMLEHPEMFRTSQLEVRGAKNRPDVRLTVDTEADYQRACHVAGQAAARYVTTEEAVHLCTQFA